jgi:chemotaxis-related protein WspB
MLFLLFELGSDRYALDVRHVAEVLPFVGIQPLPHAPVGVAGVFDFRGSPVPVVDLSHLTLGRPAERRLSTRIILVHYPLGDGGTRLLGLIAERATRTVRHAPSDFVSTGVTSDGAPYLGPVATDARGLLRWIEVPVLLTPAVRDVLFKPTKEGTWVSPTSKTC